jgi:hypothetical protein
MFLGDCATRSKPFKRENMFHTLRQTLTLLAPLPLSLGSSRRILNFCRAIDLSIDNAVWKELSIVLIAIAHGVDRSTSKIEDKLDNLL